MRVLEGSLPVSGRVQEAVQRWLPKKKKTTDRAGLDDGAAIWATSSPKTIALDGSD